MAYCFEYNSEDAAFREEVAQYLAESLPSDLADRNRTAVHPTSKDILGWQAILHKRGWSVPSWPIEFGGTGWSAKQRLIFEEESLRVGAPPPNFQAVQMLAPILHAFASEQQRIRFLPDIREGNVLWAQGFSEPNAGSDLASLKTRAVRSGEGWVVNGQKIWTSQAHVAQWIFLLVKTDIDVKPQAGISFMVVPADAPGVTVRAIPGIDGHVSLCETFLDNVYIPPEDVIGEVGKGWDYAKYLLGHERISTADVPRNKLYLKRLREIARLMRPNDRPLAEQHSFATQIAELQIEVNALEISALRALGEMEDGNADIPIASILKLCGTELMQRLAFAQVEAIGAYGAIGIPEGNGATDQPFAPYVGPYHVPDVISEALFRRSATIYGGSSEIQRQIIAKALLDLDHGKVGNTSGTMSGFLVDAAQRFTDKHYDFTARQRSTEPPAATIARNWAFFAEMGWLGVGLPEAHGGLGGNPFDTAALLEVFGAALVVEPYVASAVLASQLVAQAATPEQCRALLPPFINGDSTLILAHDEPRAGGRVEWIETRAVQSGDGYLLSGRKSLVLGAELADQLIVAARTSGDVDDRNGISLFLVPVDSHGITRQDYRTLDGRLASDYAFDAVDLAPGALLGERDQAFEPLSHAVDQAIMGSCAELLGGMTKAFWITRDYLLIRKQFGRALASFQALQHRLADIYVEIEQARSILYHGLAGLAASDPAERRQAVSAAKWRITKASHLVCGQAIQLHGGIGMTEEYPIGHYFKRLLVTESQFGSARHHLDEIVANIKSHDRA